MSHRQTNPTDGIVGQRIKAFRIQNGLSQMQLAQKLNLTFQQVQKYEKGTNRVGAGRLFDIARVFGIAIEDLFPKADWLRKFPPTGAHNSHDIATLVSSIETLRLVQAFTSIGDPKMRKRLLSFVQEIASDKEDEKTPSN